MPKSLRAGIVSYGTYIPRSKIKVKEIADFWGKSGSDIEKSLGIFEKSVPGTDEDAVTLATEAATQAFLSVNIPANKVEAILIGSESHPYSVKPTSTTVAEILGISGNYFALDTQFACKAGSGAIRLVVGLIDSQQINLGLAIGSDTAQAKPGDVLEYTASSAAAAFLLGKNDVIAQILGCTSFSTNTPDFWRRDGQKFPAHSGRFSGEPAYFSHVYQASKKLLDTFKLSPDNFAHAVFHMPNGKFPKEIAKKLGFTPKQLQNGFVVEQIGNPYSASSLLGLASILDTAKPQEKIFFCSYGSGAGSDAFIFQTTNKISDYQKNTHETVANQIFQKYYLSYPDVLKRLISKDYL